MYVYLYTQLQKLGRGKLLNFTEIHREYYKNFHFQLGLIPSTSCDLDNL